MAQNFGTTAAAEIYIDATRDVNVVGLDRNAQLASGIASNTLGQGQGSNVTIKVTNLIAQDGGVVMSSTFGLGQGGHIDIDVEKTIQSVGLPPNRTTFFSLIGATTWGSGNAGDVTLEGQRLLIGNGSQVVSVVLPAGAGNSGTVRVDMSDSIDIQGFNPVINGASAIAATTLGPGDAGDVIVNTRQLVMRNSGSIDSSTAARGNGGNIVINATQGIDISGFAPDSSTSATTIGSSGNDFGETLRNLLGLPNIPTGNSGNIQIETPILSISEGAELSVKNQGMGEGGTLTVNADRILLNNRGQITSLTTTDNGGNLDLVVGDILSIRGSSLINAESLSVGNGGNIEIEAPFIIGLDNSDIIANAMQGNGGNITIMTQGLFGLAFRNRQTLQSDITADSEFGLGGTVNLVTLGVDLVHDSAFLPAIVMDAPQIATACGTIADSRFVLAGNGGLPLGPEGSGVDNRPWSSILPDFGQIPTADFGLALDNDEQARNGVLQATAASIKPIESTDDSDFQHWQSRPQEATGMAIASDGTLQLVAPRFQNAFMPDEYAGCLDIEDLFRHQAMLMRSTLK